MPRLISTADIEARAARLTDAEIRQLRVRAVLTDDALLFALCLIARGHTRDVLEPEERAALGASVYRDVRAPGARLAPAAGCHGVTMHRLQSTAAPPLPAPIVERDPYAEGYAEGYAAAMRERAVLRVRAVVEPPAPPIERDPYAEGYAAGRLEERAAVVVVLRAVVASLPPSWAREAGMLAGAADSIERGQHLVELAPDPTADRAQIAALGQRGDHGA